MKSKTLFVSLAIHLAVALVLFGAQTRRVAARRQAIAVRVAEEKKKPPPPKPPKAPPRPPQPRKVAMVPKEPAAAPKASAPAPRTVAVATAIKMSSDDAPSSPGDIVVPTGRALASVGPAPSLKKRPGEGAFEGPCHDDPSKPEPVFKTEIEYTARARADGIEGKLKLKLTVGRDGSVINVEVLEGVSPELDAAAVDAAKKWRFKPAMACGRPVAGGTYVLARKFELGD